MSRGREAVKPTEIPAVGWKDIAFRVKDEIGTDNIGLVAAGVAFYGLLALFPAIASVIAISGLLIEPNQIVEQLNSFSGLMPAEVMTIIKTQATAVAGSREGGLGLTALIGIGVSLYSASKGIANLVSGMNVAYDEEENRGFIHRTLLTLGLTLFLIVGLLAALVVMMGVPVALAFINFGPLIEMLIQGVVWVLLALMTIGGLMVIYRYGPSRNAPKWKWTWVGAVVACVMWIVASAGFAFYVSNFGSYNESFGTIAGVVVLLMWFWISAYIVLLGAELNSEMEAQTRRDTTVGVREPMGHRGATKADELGETSEK